MRDILDEIVAHKREEVAQYHHFYPSGLLERQAEDAIRRDKGHALPSFRQALLSSPTGIIAEFKRKSPSKGWIKQEGKAGEIPLSYQQNGAAAISILTDKDYFGGYDEFIQQARATGVTIPILYKNFIIDPSQLLLAKIAGASCVLLIAAVLDYGYCQELISMAHNLQLEVLLEMHDEDELSYASLQPDVCGINNRNLGTFITNVQNSFKLGAQLPKEAVKVSESGISNPETVRQLRAEGFNGFLIGEHFMSQESPGKALNLFINQL